MSKKKGHYIFVKWYKHPKSGKIIKSKEELQKGDIVNIKFIDGNKEAIID